MSRFLYIILYSSLVKVVGCSEKRYVKRMGAFMDVNASAEISLDTYTLCGTHCQNQSKNVVNWSYSLKKCRCIERYNVYAIVEKTGWDLYEHVTESKLCTECRKDILTIGYLPRIVWLKHLDINIGMKNDNPGVLKVKLNGVLAALKLVIKSGQLDCGAGYISKWSCGWPNEVFLAVTTENKDDVILPTSYDGSTDKDFGYSQDYLTFYPGVERRYLKEGEQLKVWNIEDLLFKHRAGNNGNGYMTVETYLLLEYYE